MSHIEVRLKGIKVARATQHVNQSEVAPLCLKGVKVARTTQYVNKTEVPPLCPGWQIEVRKCVESFWRAVCPIRNRCCIEYERQLICHLELVITIYVQERLIRTSPITWDDLMSDLEAFAAASTPLLDKLNKLSPVSPVWVRIQRQDPRASLANARDGHRRALRGHTRSIGARRGPRRPRGKGGPTRVRGSISQTGSPIYLRPLA